MRPSLLLLALVLAACGATVPVDSDPDAGQPPADAAPGLDAAPPAPDAAVPDAPRPARALVTAAGTVRGGALTLDVQLGNPFAPRPVAGGELSITPDQPIYP
jgi:hypothetical protein